MEEQQGKGGLEDSCFELDRCDDRLDDHSASQVIALQEVEHLLEGVGQDSRACLRKSVHADEGLTLGGKRGDGRDFEVVAWAYTGAYKRAQDGIAGTPMEATALGISIVIHPQDGLPADPKKLTDEQVRQTRILRSVDWLDVMTQLGIAPSSRGFDFRDK